MAVRVFLVDDSWEFLESTARFLAGDPMIEVVGRALSGRDALDRLKHQKVDLVLMDLAMPQMNGLEATRRLKARPGAPRVVILTLHDDAEYRAAARAAGADEYVVKSDLGVQLLPLVHGLLDELGTS